MAVLGIAGLKKEGAEEEAELAQLDPAVALAPLAASVARLFWFRRTQKSG